MRSWVIYTLADPRSSEQVRYVGVTHQKLRARIACHLHFARKGLPNHLYNWLRKLLREEVPPRVETIHEGSGSSWGSVESWWIEWHRERDHDLTNTTEGGEGSTGYKHTPEARASMSASRMGRPLSQETMAKMTAGRIGMKQSPLANRTASLKITWEKKKAAGWVPKPCTPEGRARTIAAHTGKPRSEETKAKISATKRAKRAAQSAVCVE